MQIITSQSYIFRKETRTGTGETEKVIYGEKFAVEASKDPVLAPDWIKDTKLFQLAVSDGSLKEVEVKSSAPAPRKADTDASGLQDKK